MGLARSEKAVNTLNGESRADGTRRCPSQDRIGSPGIVWIVTAVGTLMGLAIEQPFVATALIVVATSMRSTLIALAGLVLVNLGYPHLPVGRWTVMPPQLR